MTFPRQALMNANTGSFNDISRETPLQLFVRNAAWEVAFLPRQHVIGTGSRVVKLN